MERSDDSSKQAAKTSTKEKVSGLVDGDADPDGLRTWMAQLREGEGRQAWDLYHQIGDAIRSAEPGPLMSADFDRRFTARFAARFAAEPVLLLPRRNLLARLGSWPTTMAAVAAAGFGFFIAPSLMPDAGPVAPASGVAVMTAAAPAAPLEVAAQTTTDADDTLDYIALHHHAHASLYGATPTLRPVVTDAAPRR